MNTTKCTACGQEIHFGDYPFCPHQSTIFRDAGQFQPIIVHRKTLPDGQQVYSYPGSPDEPPSPGYEKISLNSLAEADRFVKDRNREEQEIRREQIQGEKRYWEERAKERREMVKAELERRLGKSHSRIGELVARAVDARREKKYRDLANRPINFHIQALSYDKQNQKEYRDDSKKKISVVVNGFRR